MTTSQETCRQLTLYLGECWHEPEPNPDIDVMCCCKCNGLRNFRPFTTLADLFAVYGKMVERGEWAKFEQCQWDKSHTPHKDGEFTAWLFCLANPSQIGERMEMVSAWLKEKER